MKFNWKRRVIHYGCGERFIEYTTDEIPKLVITKDWYGYNVLIDGSLMHWRKTLKGAKSYVEFIYKYKKYKNI